jgi:hypothetical protein
MIFSMKSPGEIAVHDTPVESNQYSAVELVTERFSGKEAAG